MPASLFEVHQLAFSISSLACTRGKQQSERWGGEQAGWLLFLILSCFSRRQFESLSRA